jgi:hypothetical protein
METSMSDLIERDLRTGASILSRPDPNWEMLKRPEPIFYVLARHAVSTKNDWIAGGRLVQDLLPLKKGNAKTFNPDGWLGKEYTDVQSGRPGKSATSERWIPNIERSATQPNPTLPIPLSSRAVRSGGAIRFRGRRHTDARTRRERRGPALAVSSKP